jgi:hypothetical protein
MYPKNNMTTSLSESQMEELDQFISKNPPRLSYLYISVCYMENAKIIYDEIKDHPGPLYRKFGGNMYSTFALYKSKKGEIYVFQVFIQDLVDYFVVKDRNSLGPDFTPV